MEPHYVTVTVKLTFLDKGESRKETLVFHLDSPKDTHILVNIEMFVESLNHPEWELVRIGIKRSPKCSNKCA